jgi:hypothetical protein
LIYVYLKDGSQEAVPANEVQIENKSVICRQGGQEVRRFDRLEVLMYRRHRRIAERGSGDPEQDDGY